MTSCFCREAGLFVAADDECVCWSFRRPRKRGLADDVCNMPRSIQSTACLEQYAPRGAVLTFGKVSMISTPCHAQPRTLEDSGFGYTLSLIGGKYKMVVMFWLYKQPVMRFNELQRAIGSISFKTLSATLKEMERDDLVLRTEYPQIPPKVAYRLSERGKSLIPVLDAICIWGNQNRSGRAC